MSKPSNPEQSGSTKVGYGRPPERTRFKPGHSGNPRGRPKGILNMASVLRRTLRERVVIKENGRRRTVTKLQAAVTQVTNKAASGDLKAMQLLANLVRSAEDAAATSEPTNRDLGDADQKVFLGILKRLETTDPPKSKEGI